MARSTGIHLVLPAVLCFATNSLAAETGMLYAKSDPPGATVVIGGKERGKTPVLVRDLPAGEVTVELRFPGAKPVAKQVTVEAKRVAKIDVHIELPSASLTIVSEPLEATVFLDNQEVGKTPLTLEDLAPGRHELILLKDGHPRTARSVVLEPGSERVLEVKLGVPGEDETVRPASGGATAKAEAPGRVPTEVQLILTMLKEAVDKGNYADTRRNLALALGQPDMASFKEELSAAIRVVEALEMRQRHIRKGAEALVGKEVVLRTKTGPRSGKVEGVSFEGIALASKIMVAGAAAGETRDTIKLSGLAPEEQDRLAASWKPEGPDGAVARAILAQARKDKAAAARAVAAAGEHTLGKYLGGGSAAAAGPDETGKETKAEAEKDDRPPRQVEIECPCCGGSGLVKEIGCAYCGATGYAKAVKCTRCGGRARTAYSCSNCEGTGKIARAGREVDCPLCRGKGAPPCRMCKGRGKVSRPNPQATSYKTTPCAACDGDGHEKHLKCRRCRGGGKLTQRAHVRPGVLYVNDFRCPFCGGDGEAPEMCRRCNGRGSFGPKGPQQIVTPCMSCSGSGRQFLPCRRCRGRGWHRAR